MAAGSVERGEFARDRGCRVAERCAYDGGVWDCVGQRVRRAVCVMRPWLTYLCHSRLPSVATATPRLDTELVVPPHRVRRVPRFSVRREVRRSVG